MFRRPSALLLASWLAVPGLSLAADGLDPEKVAQIRREEKAAMAKVNEAHGNKKPSEMDSAERRQVIKEQQEAAAGVLEKHGVSAKEYANYTTRMGREDSKAAGAAEARLEAEEKAKKEAEAQKKSEPQEIVIQQGINEKNPVTMEGTPEDPEVAQAMAEQEKYDAMVQSMFGGGEKSAGAEEEKPARRKKKSRRGGDSDE
jgi:hypothetical protein